MKKEKLLITVAAGVGVAAVAYKLLSKDIPEGAIAVQSFDMDRYLGTWHEIARLPNRLEKDIKGLTEEYSAGKNGSYKVVTKGYNTKSRKWVKAAGKMKFADEKDVGMLKVSYFGPFYVAYNVLFLDPDYKYALVCGRGLDLLWILSKETTIPEEIKEQFLYNAKAIGFEVDKLEWPSINHL
jgi:apolipoprotein D and lipocalin family protein